MSEACRNCGCVVSHGEYLDADGYCGSCAAGNDNEYDDRACCRACGVRIPESIRKCFDIEEKDGKYEFWCKHCPKGWELPVDNKHAGNILFLLNHARKHKRETTPKG